jgi:predicted dehydrogenase
VISSRTRPAALAAQFDVEIADDADALIERVDIVGILAPTPTHPDLALRAIARKRHVVCESRSR